MQHASQSPLNFSKTKSLYSFPKQQRFPSHTNPYCDSIYNIPPSFSKRGASIGYGKRFQQMINKSVAPGPQAYNAPSTKDSKAFSFGMSRDKFDKVYLKENPPRDKSVPGPAAYQAKMNYVERQAAAYSLRPNTSYQSMFNDPTKNNPGPGSYNGQTATENKNGFYLYSRYKSPGGAIISSTGKRFDNREQKTSREIPGPGQYTAQPQNTWRNHGSTVIGKSKRQELVDKSRRQTPGPGSYRVQSEFGFYEANESNLNASLILNRRSSLAAK